MRDTPLKPIALIAVYLLALTVVGVGPTDATVDGQPATIEAEPVTHPEPLVVGNGSETYTVAGQLPDGDLHVATWYVDGRYRGSTRLDGESDTASFTPSLAEGPHTVTAHVWDDSWDRSDRVRWNVTVTSNRTATPTREDRSLYVWSEASTVVTETGPRDRFFDRVDANNVSTVYLSWGASRDVPRADLVSFLRRADERGLAVHALVSAGGAENVAGVDRSVEGVLAYNDGRADRARFDGVHLDVEPESPSELDTFLDAYRTLLTDADTAWTANGTTLDSQELPLRIAVAPWWAQQAPERTQTLLERESVDGVTIMAYSDSLLGVDQRTEAVTALDVTVPYEIAVETDEIGDSGVTFYEEGPAVATRALEAVGRPRAEDPQFRGAALHAYDPSLTRWDSVRSVEATVDGDEVRVDSSVVFDEPAGGDGTALQVTVSAEGETTTTSVTLDTVEAYTTEQLSVTLSTPTAADSYDVRVSTVDLTRPGNRTVTLDTATVTT